MLDKKLLINTCFDLISERTLSSAPDISKMVLEKISFRMKKARLVADLFDDNGVYSLLIHDRMVKNNFDILLHGHLDVVAASDKQFNSKIIGDKLYGRGALDMKGALATMLLLAQKSLIRSKHALLITTDEEIGGTKGAGYITKSGLAKSNFVITGEPTNLTLANEEKGVIWFLVKLKGKSAHAAKPWEGVNPNFQAAELILKLTKSFPTSTKNTWVTTVIPTIISSLNSQNQIPEDVILKCDCRYIPSDNPQKIIQKIIKTTGPIEVQLLEPPLFALDHPYVRKILDLVNNKRSKMHFATDARYFGALGTPSVIFGPTGEGMHSENEWVSIASLIKYYEILEKFLLQSK